MKKTYAISAFAESILQSKEANTMHIIAFNQDQLVAYDEKTKRAKYYYKVNDDMEFCFSLISEVGQIYQIWFKDILNKLKYQIKQTETQTDYFDVLIKTTP